MRYGKRSLAAAGLAAMILTLSGCARGDSLIIGAQTFSEPKILAQMYNADRGPDERECGRVAGFGNQPGRARCHEK
ncbi:hypothetical protein LJK88_03090 [Paenibacillus sp. P26]|nr:hypothetical protein LJK88_03090 [Paenibacillus sp. P26]